MKQFITSLQDCQDIEESGEFKLIQKIVPTEAVKIRTHCETDLNLEEFLINDNGIEVREKNANAEDDTEEGPVNPQPVDPDKPESVHVSPTISTVSSHASSTSTTSGTTPKSPNNVEDNCHPEMTSVGYKLFPYDNPERVMGRDLAESHEIISLPFPFTVPTQGRTLGKTDCENDTSSVPQQRTNARLPSVSKILNVTMAPEQVEILKKWEQRMIQQMGEEGFRKYKEGEAF